LGADNIIAQRQTFSLTENRKQATHFSLRSCRIIFFIIVTEVANAVRLGVYVMRVPTITRVLPCQIL